MSKHSSNAEVLFPSEDESMMPSEKCENKSNKHAKSTKTSHHSRKLQISSSSEDESSLPPQLDSKVISDKKNRRSAPSAAKKSHHSSKPQISSSSEDELLPSPPLNSDVIDKKQKKMNTPSVPSATKKSHHSTKASSSSSEDEQSSRQQLSSEKKRKRTPLASACSSHGKKKVKINPIATNLHQSTANELFGSDSDEPQPSSSKPLPGKLQSYVTRRLSNGYSRQTHPTKTGSHYIDLKIYKCSEIEKVLPVNRWRQSIVTIKTQTDDNTNAWQHLANFVIAIRKEYRTCTPTFVSNYY